MPKQDVPAHSCNRQSAMCSDTGQRAGKQLTCQGMVRHMQVGSTIILGTRVGPHPPPHERAIRDHARIRHGRRGR